MGCMNGVAIKINHNDSKGSNEKLSIEKINCSAIYYTALGEKPNEIRDKSISKLIEIFVFTQNANPLNYKITLSEQNQHIKNIIGSASTVSIGENQFTSSFRLSYYFERNQNILVDLISENEQTQYNFLVGKLMGSRGQRIEIPMNNQPGSLIFQAEPIKNEEFSSEIQINAKSNNTYQDFYFYIKKNVSEFKEEPRFVNIYRSEIIYSFANNTFNLIQMNSSTLKTKTNQILIEFYSSKTKISEFLMLLDDPNQKSLSNSILTSNQIQVEFKIFHKKNHRFTDFLRGGVQISLIIGIDFTASNGEFTQHNSLHYISKKENDYEKAISSCGNIVAYYDYDQLFPVFGYGATYTEFGNVSHCFNLNFQDDPNIFMIQNILIQYRDSLRRLRFGGPTLFEPIIRDSIEICRRNQSNNIYYILLMITDGQICDMIETIDAIVEASFLPISIIIIGVGKGDFSSMDTLDADINPLINQQNVKACRDIVQFVEFNKYKQNPEQLANQVLEEIPYQVVEYFSRMNIEPQTPIFLNQ